jgi:hypothetical protein
VTYHEKKKVIPKNINHSQPTTFGNPVRDADTISRNVEQPPMKDATRKLAVKKKYQTKLMCAIAGYSRSPELLTIAMTFAPIIHAAINPERNKSALFISEECFVVTFMA